MNSTHVGTTTPSGLSNHKQLVELLDLFLADWKRGGSPRLEDYLTRVQESERAAALRMLLELEVTLRRNEAREPNPGDYEARFPQYQDVIRSVFRGDATTAPLVDFEPTTEYATGSHPRPSSGEASEVQVHLLEEIGRGGMGVVHRARKQVWRDGKLIVDRLVAVKKLNPAYAADATALRRLCNEGVIASRQTNARILQVEDVVDLDGNPGLVMPLIEGGSLDRTIQKAWAKAEGVTEDGIGAEPSAFPLEQVLALLDQLVEAVAALHEGRVLHRDIKPSNVLIDQDGLIRLGDFGLARLAHESELTPGGISVGTPGYMSPEQHAGRADLDYRSDVYSLGATLYKALTGELPYGKLPPRPDELLPIPPGEYLEDLPPAIDAVILKALQPDRARRYANGGALRDDWRRARSDASWRPPLPKSRHRRRGRRGVWLGAAVLAIGLAATVGFWLARIWNPANAPVPVIVATTPAADRAVFVPIDADSGRPRIDLAVRGAPEADAAPGSPIRVELPPGEYIVEVAAGARFQEVRRRVPDAQERRSGRGFITRYRNLSWMPGPDGAIAWPNILIPDVVAADGMAYFEGDPNFLVGASDGLPTTAQPHEVALPAFFLDTQEVTAGQYRRFRPDEASACGLELHDEMAICCVNLYDALQYAEQVGKRLPDEFEYEYAATGGGTRRYPWGDDLGPLADGVWFFGPAGSPPNDRTATDPPVFGLYSNVVEWTASLHRPYPGESWDHLPSAAYNTARVVRGGPASAVNRTPMFEDPRAIGPRMRSGFSPENAYPGLGFRCARSAAPRFLDQP